jgi:hypothetical protein
MYYARCNETNDIYSHNDYRQLITIINNVIVENIFYIISKIEYEKFTLMRNDYNDINYINNLDLIIINLKNHLNNINENFILFVDYPISYSNYKRTFELFNNI